MSPVAVDEGLSPALGALAASRAQGSEKGQESPTSLSWGQGTGGHPPVRLPSFLPLWTREAAGSWRGRPSVHRGHLAVVQAELLGLETEAGDAVGHIDPRGRGA